MRKRQTGAAPAGNEAPAANAAGSTWRYPFILGAFVVLALLAYLPVLNDSLVADDYGHITRVGWLEASELWRVFTVQSPIFMRPLPFLSVWILYQIFGLEWFASHVLNVVMHGANAFLLFWLLTRLSASFRLAFLSSILFLFTPIAPEAVSWTAGRFDVWALFFMLLALALYQGALEKKSRPAFAGAMAAAMAALFSKESAMVLIVMFPVLEIVNRFFPGSPGLKLPAKADWLRTAGIRLLIFGTLFAGYVAFRYAVMGRIGNYRDVPLFGVPSPRAAVRSFLTLLSPLDSLMVSGLMINLMRLSVGLLLAVSVGLVIFRWRKASVAARRTWIFLVAFFLASLAPVYHAFFISGLTQLLNDSRFFYVTMAAFLGIVVTGLIGFGWRSRSWQIAAGLAILLLVPLSWWGIQQNNRVWSHSAQVADYIPEETVRLLPDPPENATLYFRNLPMAWGGHLLGGAIVESVSIKYDRSDLQIHYVDPMMEWAPWFSRGVVPLDETGDGYLFVFEPESETLYLERGPAEAP
ncbi:MAG: hypothetical protein IBX61_03830 [Thermoleophilia bacterium]|nr:hypothetical protein [Thermoleophilia bacterium]